MSSVIIVDYGLGNMRSVSKAVQKAGATVHISHNLEEIRSAEGIILPGVGAFHEGMTQLADLSQALVESEGHVPILVRGPSAGVTG